MEDERKRKRKQSNRESARRSRMRKQQRLDELSGQVNQLEEENKKVMKMIDGASQLYLDFASENNVLRAQAVELTDRLRSLNSVIHIASEVSGMAFDVPDVPSSDSLLEPWKLPCPMQAIPADMLI
ncbi:basic-leucine zipper transcription factor family protein [Striga asiatica]|uniref:Basic-leucine zipper transcription factor family protein n=1 Tax=Striga asiatica TaxID=4170 RepID=A0A5A7PQX5_STRAF|nr:basic-leucine zipper transcription factor family protein [Striga asiatica]